MKVVSAIASLTHGGAETVLVNLVLGLTGHEHRVVHSTVSRGMVPNPVFMDALDRVGATCFDVPFAALASRERRQEWLQGFEPDVVLFHWWGEDFVPPWVVDAHNDPRRPQFVCVLHHAETPAPVGFDHYVIVTRIQMDQLPPLPAERIHLIPNGIDLARFANLPRKSAPGEGLVIGRLSRLSPDKIPADWVAMVGGWRVPGARFVVAGDGKLLPTIEADVQRLALNGTIELAGYVPSALVPALLASFDVFCHVTSTAVECGPLALLEAAAAGLPIVAERRGGIPEIVTDGVNGLLGDSPDEIGRHLNALHRDRALLARLADGAVARASVFSLTRQVEAYQHLLAVAAC